MVSVLTATIFKQTLVPIVNYLKCFSYGNSKDIPKEVRRITTEASLEENLDEAQGPWSGQVPCKPNNDTMRIQSASIIGNSFMPVHFHPEPSMHHPACPDYSKTRLHALPITKSLENPVTCESPWSPLLGGCRWFSNQQVDKKAEMFRAQDDINGNCVFKDVEASVSLI